jgi:hypothetical protein
MVGCRYGKGLDRDRRWGRPDLGGVEVLEAPSYVIIAKTWPKLLAMVKRILLAGERADNGQIAHAMLTDC